MKTWTEEHSAAIADAAPQIRQASGAELGRAWAAVQSRIASPVPAKPKRRAWIGVSVALVLRSR